MRAHFLDDERELSAADLAAQGIPNQHLEVGEHAAALAALAERAGYVHQDEVALSPETPNLEAICAKFDGEHHHDDDEVRFVLEGAGIFDIRSTDDRWMRVLVERGDLIVVPKGRRHRFFLTDERRIRCARLFTDEAGWVAHYR